MPNRSSQPFATNWQFLLATLATVLAFESPSRGDDSPRVLEVGGATAEASIGQADAMDRYRFRVAVAGDYRIETTGPRNCT